MWTNLLKRIFNIGKAEAHAALDEIEDPVKMMKLAVGQLEEAIAKVTKALSVAMANHQRLADDTEQFNLECISWYQKARLALQNGHSELAQKALTQKSFADKKHTEYTLLTQNSAQMVKQLQEQVEDLKLKLDETKTKQRIYAAKAETAKAQQQIAASLGGLNHSALANMTHYEDKIKQWEAEGNALTQINSMKNHLDKSLRGLQQEINIQEDFERLQQELKAQKEKEKNQKMADLQTKFDEMNQTQAPQKQPFDKLLNDFFNNAS